MVTFVISKTVKKIKYKYALNNLKKGFIWLRDQVNVFYIDCYIIKFVCYRNKFFHNFSLILTPINFIRLKTTIFN